MRKQRISPRGRRRAIDESGEPLSLRVDEVEPFGRHVEPSCSLVPQSGGTSPAHPRSKKIVRQLSEPWGVKRSFNQDGTATVFEPIAAIKRQRADRVESSPWEAPGPSRFKKGRGS